MCVVLTACEARPQLWDALRDVRHDGREVHLSSVAQQREQQWQHAQQHRLHPHARGSMSEGGIHTYMGYMGCADIRAAQHAWST